MIWIYVLIALVPILSYYLFKSAVGDLSLRRLNIISVVFYFWLILVCYFGSVLMVLGVKAYYLTGVQQELVNKVFLTVAYVMITLPMGIALANALFFRRNPKMLLRNFYEGVTWKRSSYNYRFWICCLLVSIVAGVYTSIVVPKIPIIRTILGGSANEILYYRYIAKFDFPGIIYIKTIFFHLFAVISSFVLFSIYLRNRNNTTYLIIAIISIFWAFYSELFNGEKAPIVFYSISLLFIYYISLKKRIGRKAIKIGVVALLGVSVMYYLIEGGVNISLTSGMLSRIVLVPLGGLFFTYMYFPERADFLYGASFPEWIVSNFGLEHKRSARLIMELRNSAGVEEGTAGVVNSLFTAEAFANFGLFGLLVSPFIVGLSLGIIHFSIIKTPMNYLNTALLVYFMFNIPILGGFVDFIWNISWFCITFLAILSRKIKI